MFIYLSICLSIYLLVYVFPTSLCGVLVFRLDPAASPPPSVRRAAFTTHHSPTSHTSLITAQLININHLTYHSTTHHSSTSHTSLITSSLLTSLITSPLLTAPLLTLTSHTSLITSSPLTSPLTSPLITAPLLTPHSSYYHSTTHHSSVVSRLPFSWQVQCGCLSRAPARANRLYSQHRPDKHSQACCLPLTDLLFQLEQWHRP